MSPRRIRRIAQSESALHACERASLALHKAQGAAQRTWNAGLVGTALDDDITPRLVAAVNDRKGTRIECMELPDYATATETLSLRILEAIHGNAPSQWTSVVTLRNTHRAAASFDVQADTGDTSVVVLDSLRDSGYTRLGLAAASLYVGKDLARKHELPKAKVHVQAVMSGIQTDSSSCAHFALNLAKKIDRPGPLKDYVQTLHQQGHAQPQPPNGLRQITDTADAPAQLFKRMRSPNLLPKLTQAQRQGVVSRSGATLEDHTRQALHGQRSKAIDRRQLSHYRTAIAFNQRELDESRRELQGALEQATPQDLVVRDLVRHYPQVTSLQAHVQSQLQAPGGPSADADRALQHLPLMTSALSHAIGAPVSFIDLDDLPRLSAFAQQALAHEGTHIAVVRYETQQSSDDIDESQARPSPARHAVVLALRRNPADANHVQIASIDGRAHQPAAHHITLFHTALEHVAALLQVEHPQMRIDMRVHTTDMLDVDANGADVHALWASGVLARTADAAALDALFPPRPAPREGVWALIDPGVSIVPVEDASALNTQGLEWLARYPQAAGNRAADPCPLPELSSRQGDAVKALRLTSGDTSISALRLVFSSMALHHHAVTLNAQIQSLLDAGIEHIGNTPMLDCFVEDSQPLFRD